MKTDPESNEASCDLRGNFHLPGPSLAKLQKWLFSKNKSYVPHFHGLAIVLTAVFPLGSAAFGAFGARRSDG